jgi:GTP-binding protein
LLWKVKNLLDKQPITQHEFQLPVYRPESAEKVFKIIPLKRGWKITGAAIERAAEMTYWEYIESVRRFHRILESLGIGDALRKAGIHEGDSVFISGHEFEWTFGEGI